MITVWVIAGVILAGCLGFIVACILFTVGGGDEHERDLRKKMLRDVAMYRNQCYENYPCNLSMVDKIFEEVEYIIRSEQV